MFGGGDVLLCVGDGGGDERRRGEGDFGLGEKLMKGGNPAHGCGITDGNAVGGIIDCAGGGVGTCVHGLFCCGNPQVDNPAEGAVHKGQKHVTYLVCKCTK